MFLLFFQSSSNTNQGAKSGKGGDDNWNNIGMHNLFRLDKRSV